MKHTTRLIFLSLSVSPIWSLHCSAAERLYQSLCATCHGSSWEGGLATALIRSPLLANGQRDDIARIIRDGAPQAGMPAFGSALSQEEIDSLIDLMQTQFDTRSPTETRTLGATIEAESLNPARSSGYRWVRSEENPHLEYLGHFDHGSVLCYDDIDLTGVKSIEFEWARGSNDPGRFAILITDSSGLGQRINLGEKVTTSTGGWETFARARVGLSQTAEGRHSLSFYGLEGGGIFNLTRFTLSDQPAENDGVTQSFGPAGGSFSAAGHSFTLERVAEAAGELWAMTFLPDGSIIATQKNGHLLLINDSGFPQPIAGVPEVWNRNQGGLLAVKAHPDYTRNGWIYLTFSDPAPDGTSMTRVTRGKLDRLNWVEQEDIYVAPPEFYTESYAHFGSRLVILDDYIYFSVGDRTQSARAQELGSPFGKIHRLHADGSVPQDNPFVGRRYAQASIWSYGHRNPQGLTAHPVNQSIWSAEHGPRGGDEVNLIRKGLNYGWPLATHGIDYDGTTIAESPHLNGMEPPVHHWTPSIAVSQIEFYTGDRFPQWRNHLLAASLAQQELRLLRLENDLVSSDVILFKDFGRIRDVVDGPDGYPYVVINNPNGTIYRLAPNVDSDPLP